MPYTLLAAVASGSGGALAGWPWLLAFFLILTFGELYILPTGLGLFAKLAPPRLGATTVAAWFLTIFTGSLAAGLVGTLWSKTSHAAFFLLLAGLALCAAGLLLAARPPDPAAFLTRNLRRHEHAAFPSSRDRPRHRRAGPGLRLRRAAGALRPDHPQRRGLRRHWGRAPPCGRGSER